jgi:hypothetical protein
MATPEILLAMTYRAGSYWRDTITSCTIKRKHHATAYVDATEAHRRHWQHNVADFNVSYNKLLGYNVTPITNTRVINKNPTLGARITAKQLPNSINRLLGDTVDRLTGV